MIKKLNGKTCGYIAAVAVLLLSFLLTGCGSDDTPKAENGKEKVTIALWGNDLLENYAPYLCRQFPDVEFEFVLATNSIDYYRYLNEHGDLPDIMTVRRFSMRDAMTMKDVLYDLSNTDLADTYYGTYLDNYTYSDGTVNWLPVCAEVDNIIVNKTLFEENDIPLPTDYDSFVAACQSFEKLGIRGFAADFVYDYTCMEILQGMSIPEITSMEGSMWRSSYEDPEGEENGLDDTVWPVVFENMEQFIKDVNLVPEDTEMDYDPVINMFTEGKAAMNKDLEQNAARKEKALRVLGVMLSEGAQKVLSNNQDVITYNRNVDLELSPCLENLKPIISQNHMYIRVASNDFFAVSKDVVTKMLQGEYDARQAYEAFDSQLRQPKDDQSETILTQEKGYSRVFYTKGGNASYSAMANTVRNLYGGDVLVAPGYSFTGSVLAAEYTEKQVGNLIMPNGLFAYSGEMTGQELKECIRDYVEGIEGGFKPFNRGSLPVVSGVAIKVQEQDGEYILLEVKKDGKAVKDDEVFKVVCLNNGGYMAPFLAKESPVLEKAEQNVKADLTEYIKSGNTLEAPEDYITLKIASR